jgi:hypothetical protein
MWCGGVAKSGIAVWRKRRCGELLVWRKLRRDGVAETAVWRVLRTAVWRVLRTAVWRKLRMLRKN